MAYALSMPVKRFYQSFNDIINKNKHTRDLLISIANSIRAIDGIRVLVIDGTMISKAFAKAIKSLSVDYDGVIRRVSRGLSIMVAGLVTGGNIIPLDFLFWYNKKDISHQYKTKTQLAIELIEKFYKLVSIDYVALDGAFASSKMIESLEKFELKYSMRIPKNRKVVINGVNAPLDQQHALSLVKNERCKTAAGFYQGHACFFTIHKRKKRGGGWERVFIISNMNLTAKEHVIAYNRRWTIDKSFRTQKQYLGLKDCQMLSDDKQTFHILNVFLGYAYATMEKISKRKKSVEEVIKHLWKSKKF
jgi:hypothetical protein